MFLLANQQELERAIDVARELRAIRNILKSQNRLEDLSESQQKQLKQKEGELDLAARVALTNAYRHLFYPSNDPIKAPKGLMHYPLPAQDASDVKGKNNQQEAIVKALKDCQKVRPDNAQPYAPAYVLQKVWATGLDSISTKGLKEAFAKDLGLNLFSDAETSKLRTTIVQGLTTGQWDLRVSERVYIKTDAAPLVPPDIIEFSDRMVLYRRGILELPKPREIEINAQVMPSTQQSKPVRVRWKAAGALSVKLFQDGVLVAGIFLPSDEYEGDITQSTVFRIVADYGEEETAAAEYKARVQTYPTSSGGSAAVRDTPELFDVKPEFIDFAGSLNSVFNDLRNRVHDDKISAIARLEITVSQVIDYRKLTTALPLLMRYPIGIDQFVTIQTGDQFVRLEYQDNVKGFQGFANPTNTLLATAEVRAEVSLKITFEFAAPIDPQGMEMKAIEQALGRNPVDRLNLRIKVLY